MKMEESLCKESMIFIRNHKLVDLINSIAHSINNIEGETKYIHPLQLYSINDNEGETKYIMIFLK